ncbi:urea transporter [Pseudomonas sp. BMS12]|uniref:urea transporter n=1 Tax=Pseudomonas sp. BMS12 TaxID=1796033 RepID=UPI00083AB086|nr:urea transporter [Pseudomonas sp. BMS12]
MPPFAGFRALLCGFAQIFLQQRPGFGLAVLLALLIGAPDRLGDALLGALAGTLVAQRRGYSQADIDAGLYGYNGALLGLLLSLKLAWTPLLPLLILGSAGLSSLLLARWLRASREREWLPAYTLPFVLFGWLLPWLGASLGLAPAAEGPAPSLASGLWPAFAEATLRGLGQVIFLDHPLAGLCLLIGLSLCNHRCAAWALAAAALPAGLALLAQQPSLAALAGLHGYSPVLAAIALAQSHRQPWAPLAGIVLSLALQPGFAALGLAPLTMPFILACWLVEAGTRSWRSAAEACAPSTGRK